MKYYHRMFAKFSERASDWAGSSSVFMAALLIVLVWAITGPLFGFSEDWQLVINTGTTIVTFLLVFLIQNSQNRETRAIQLKLDELIRATEGAHTVMLDLEKMTAEELTEICSRYEAIAKQARERLRNGETDTDIPEVEVFNVRTGSDG